MNAPVVSNYLPDASTETFKDKKRYYWLLAPSLPLIEMTALFGYMLAPKKLRFLTLFAPTLLHAIMPVLDKLGGEDLQNPSPEAIKQLEKDPYYERIVASYIPTQFALNLFATYLGTRKETPLLDRLCIAVSLGIINGVSINTAHELSHKASKLDQFLSHLSLIPTGYNHFRVEHVYGHHKRVATPEDPASSRMGESFYEFLPRTVVGSFKSAIEIQTTRMQRMNKPFWSKHNELVTGWGMSAGFHAGMIALFGKRAVPFLALQAMYGFTLFELVNYLEHYGLKRAKKENGDYTRTMPEHSWNSNSLVSNLFLYQLQRHSDHHAFPTRPFQALRNFDEAPQLPSGYAGMMLPALVPKWWRKLMDPRLVEYYKGDISKMNISPKHYEEVVAYVKSFKSNRNK